MLGGDSVHDAVRDPEARDKTSTKPLKQLLCTDLYQLLWNAKKLSDWTLTPNLYITPNPKPQALMTPMQPEI